MKPLVHSITGFIVLVCPTLSGQTVPVDWLEPSAQGGGQFQLLDESSGSVAEAELQAVVGFPLEAGAIERYDGSRWQDSSLVPVNEDGDRSVDGFRVRVAPFGDTPSWKLTISAQERGSWFFAVGSLYHDATASHGPLLIEARQNGVLMPIEFLGTSGWDDGTDSLQGGLNWSPVTRELVPDSANEGESGMGFFKIVDFGGDDSELVLTMPAGFDAGAAGDDVAFAVGFSIPEPSSLLLVAGSSLLLLSRRR